MKDFFFSGVSSVQSRSLFPWLWLWLRGSLSPGRGLRLAEVGVGRTVGPVVWNHKVTPQPGVLCSAAHTLLGGTLVSNSRDLNSPKNQ